MGLETEFVTSSRCYGNSDLPGQMRVLDICHREGATLYVNPPSGRGLYDPKSFRDFGIDLRFIVMRPFLYGQRSKPFISTFRSSMD